ncbi:hypothetical protein K438DRAFT_1850014 [Mycena galopus ATCC 62051]|nr:hypothetical protein K438DRAFT_1850014 [Mycena galopus ATCC 62051]
MIPYRPLFAPRMVAPSLLNNASRGGSLIPYLVVSDSSLAVTELLSVWLAPSPWFIIRTGHTSWSGPAFPASVHVACV